MPLCYPPPTQGKSAQSPATDLHQRVLFYESHDERQLEEIDKDTASLEVELWSTVQAAVAQLTRSWPRGSE